MNSVNHSDPKPTASSERASPYRVLVVDDEPAHCRLVTEILNTGRYEVTLAADGRRAVERMQQQAFDAVVLDYYLPDATGADVCRVIRRDERLKLLPVLMVTGDGGPSSAVECLRAGANDVIRKPYPALELEARVRSAAERKRLTDRLDDAESVLFTLARMAEARDAGTGDHCDRLSHLGEVFGIALGLSWEHREVLRSGAILHDIGKIAIPDAILLKPGPLDAQDWAVMRKHPEIGAHMCGRLRTMRGTVEIIRHHHERWNGSGYPDGLAGEAIPYLARVFQVLDVFDALASERPYKRALPLPEVLAIMRAEAAEGKLDPTLVAVFLELAQASPDQLRAPAASNPLLAMQDVLEGTRFAA